MAAAFSASFSLNLATVAASFFLMAICLHTRHNCHQMLW